MGCFWNQIFVNFVREILFLGIGSFEHVTNGKNRFAACGQAARRAPAPTKIMFMPTTC